MRQCHEKNPEGIHKLNCQQSLVNAFEIVGFTCLLADILVFGYLFYKKCGKFTIKSNIILELYIV